MQILERIALMYVQTSCKVAVKDVWPDTGRVVPPECRRIVGATGEKMRPHF